MRHTAACFDELRAYLDALLESDEPEARYDIFQPAIAQLHRQYLSTVAAYEDAD